MRRGKEEGFRRVCSVASMPKCIQVLCARLHTQYHRVKCMSSLRLRNYRMLEVTKLAKCPPESGGQHDRDSSRDRAGGGSRAELFKNAFRDNSFGEPPLASS